MEVAFPAPSQAQSEHTGPCGVQEPLLPAAPPPAWLSGTNSIVVFHVLRRGHRWGEGIAVMHLIHCQIPQSFAGGPRGAVWLESTWRAAREAGLGVDQVDPRHLSLEKR